MPKILKNSEQFLFLEKESSKKEKEEISESSKEAAISSISISAENLSEINKPSSSDQKTNPPINEPVLPELVSCSQMDVQVEITSNGQNKLADAKQEAAQSSQEEVDLDSMTLDERLRFMQQRDHEEPVKNKVISKGILSPG